MSEWQSWIAGHDHGRVLGFWMGESPLLRRPPAQLSEGWWLAKESGMAVCELNDWVLRLNAGPTGYRKPRRAWPLRRAAPFDLGWHSGAGH